MQYNPISLASGNPSEVITLSERSFCFPQESEKKEQKLTCFQYVNPSLLLQWEGDVKKTNQICGSGIFRAYQRSKDGNHKSKLVLSLQADKWKDGKPYGQVKFMQVFFYDSTRKNNIVKEVRRFVGRMENLMKEGYGEYTIEHFYSNETKDITEIKGMWTKDALTSATVLKNGQAVENIKFSNNVEISPKHEGPSLEGINLVINKDRKNSSRIMLSPIIASNRCLVIDVEKKSDSAGDQTKDPKGKSIKNITPNLLAPPQSKPSKSNQKSLR